MSTLALSFSHHRELRGGVDHDTLAEDLAGRSDPGGIGCRGQGWRRETPRLLSRSLSNYMSGRTTKLGAIVYEMVEEHRIEDRICLISTRKSGRMISSLPSISIAIWLAIAASLLFLSAVLVLARSGARYPYFSTLIHFTTFSCYALLAVGWWASLLTYFWSYYAFRVISDLLTALVAWEVYRKVFGPAAALPPATPRRIALNLLMVLSLWALLALLLRATVTGTYTRIAITGQQMLYGGLAGTFGVLVLYSRKMGISWRPRVAKITYGFALILIVNLVMAVVTGRTHGRLARAADDIGQIAYLFSYSYWAWCFWEKEQPVPTNAPPELVSVLAKELETLKSTLEVSTQV